MQRSGELAAAKSSWLVTQKKIPKKRLPAILNLLPVKDEVLALSSAMDKMDLRQSCAALTKDLLQMRDVDTDTLHLEFAAAEHYCNESRNSIISSTGSAMSRSSIFSQCSTRSSLYSMISQYSGQTCNQQRYYCPTCGHGFSRSNDMLSHMRNKCEPENLIRYKCFTCNEVDEVEDRMQRHVKENHASMLSDWQALGSGKFEVPAKRSFGCPYCETSCICLLEYHDHLLQLHFKKEKVNHRGSTSMRVRNGVRAAKLVGRVRDECRRRNLDADCWEFFEWDDANAEWFWDHLEYGIRDEDNDPFGEMGIEDPDSFVAALIDHIDETSCDVVLDPTLFSLGPGASPYGNITANVAQKQVMTSPKAPAIVQHPRLERLRREHGLPMRSHPGQTPIPSSSGTVETRAPTATTTPCPPFFPTPPLPQPTHGHKHALSENSAVHPDGTKRSRNSPAPPTIAEASPIDSALGHYIPEADDLSDVNFFDNAFLPSLDDTTLFSGLGSMSMDAASFMDWDD